MFWELSPVLIFIKWENRKENFFWAPAIMIFMMVESIVNNVARSCSLSGIKEI
jgi:hypothetical protein